MIDFLATPIRLRSAWLLATIALFACGGGGDTGASPGGPSNMAAPQSARASIEINADSICAATGVPETCAKLLSTSHPEWTLDDRAIRGLSFDSIYSGYDQVWVGGPMGMNGIQPAFASAAHPSKLVVIALGFNDAYSGLDPTAYEAHLLSTVQWLKTQGKVVVLTGIPPVWNLVANTANLKASVLAAAKTNNDAARRVASITGSAFAGWDALPRYETLTDGLHPTAPQLEYLTLLLAQAIQKSLT